MRFSVISFKMIIEDKIADLKIPGRSVIQLIDIIAAFSDRSVFAEQSFVLGSYKLSDTTLRILLQTRRSLGVSVAEAVFIAVRIKVCKGVDDLIFITGTDVILAVLHGQIISYDRAVCRIIRICVNTNKIFITRFICTYVGQLVAIVCKASPRRIRVKDQSIAHVHSRAIV